MAIATIPKPYYEVAFNADPNQVAIPPYWTDISSRVQFAWTAGRGRQYELDQNETGEWHPVLANPDGALDPTNSASPFWPNVVPYRGARIRVPTAPTANLLPQSIATGGLTKAAVSGWWFPVAGSIAYVTGLAAAPPGQTNAVAWTTSPGTTSSAPLLFGGSAVGPMADIVQVVAGQQYTASVYGLRAASADATLAATGSIVWYNALGTAISTSSGSAATLATGSWGRLTVAGATAPAGAQWGRVQVAITTPASTTATNVVYLTGAQFEQAAAASAWADPGPTFFIFDGYMERWPQEWTELDATYGTGNAVGVDPFAGLSQSTLLAPFLNEVLALGPNFFYTLSDPAGSSSCADLTGKRVAAPVENSPFGAGSLTFGGSITAASQPSGLFTGAAGPVATFNNPAGGPTAQSSETFISLHKTTTSPGPPASGAWTRLITFRCPTAPTAGNEGNIWTAYPPSWLNGNLSSFWVQVGASGLGTGRLQLNCVNSSNAGLQYTSAGSICDGNWHQVAMAVDGLNNLMGFYLDGALVASNGAACFPTGIVTDVIGCSITTGTNSYAQGFSGDVAHVAEFPAALTATQITNLYNSWRTASQGESSGARVQRVLTWIGWTGPTAIDAGMTSSMGPATDLTGATALDAINNITLTENGDFFASSAGVLTFQARNARYNKTTPVYTFGENTGAGEWPYEAAPAFDYDPSHIASTVQVTQYGGSTFTASDAASAKRSFPRIYTRTVNVTNPNEANDAANYLLSQLKTARLRVSALRLHPSVIPGLFAVCLNLELGMRIRVNRRPNGAPQITFDGFIEKIDWTWDPETGDVFVDLQCSPADLVKYWTMAALHTTLNLQAASGQNKATINALPDAAANLLSQSLPGGYQLTFEPGTVRAETMTIAPGGIPTTTLGYTSAQLTFTANFAFTHNAGTAVCEPLPAGITDPATYDTQSVLGAATTSLNQPATAGTNTITINALPDAKLNSLASSVPQSWAIWLSPGTPNFETATVAPTGIPATFPGWTSATLTLTGNLAHNHSINDIVCDPLPGGDTNPAQVAATTIPAY